MPDVIELRVLIATALVCASLVPGSATAAEPDSIATTTSVERLLESAAADLRATRLTSPPGNNAYERLRRVLDLEPANREARDGLVAIVRRYIGLADEAVAKRRFGRAVEFLERAATVMPGSELVAIARDDVERARTRAARALPLQTRIVRPAPVPETRPSAAPAAPTTRPLPAAPVTPAVQANAPSAPAAMPATAPPPAPRRHALAIFPFETIVPCYIQVGKDVRRAAQRLVASRADADLTWSYYADGVDESDIPPPERVWSDNRAKPVPVPSAVSQGGRAVGASTVLMAWYFCSQSERMTADTYEVEVFVVDVESGQVDSVRRRLDYADEAVEEALARSWKGS